MVKVISHPKPSLIFDLPMVLFISFLILTLPNRMGLQRENTDTLLSAFSQCNHSTLPISYWSYAVATTTTTHSINRLPTLLHQKSPWELLFNTSIKTLLQS